jgi:hypothetical protein
MLTASLLAPRPLISDHYFFPLSPSVLLLIPPVTTTPKPPKIVKESAKNTNFYQKMTKSARFLQKNTKKYQFFTIFLTQITPKFTTFRQIRKPKFYPPTPCGGQTAGRIIL